MKARILQSACFAKTPAHLILHVTNRCGLRCKTCFVDFNKCSREKELTLEQIKGIAGRLKKLVWLDISGGEPFLRDDLPDICGEFDVTAISIPTNGFDARRISGLAQRVRDKISADLTVSLSLDGFEKTNDYIRGENSFKSAIETLQLLKLIKGIKVKINTVLCEKNYAELIDFMRFIKKFNIDFHSIIFLRAVPRSPEFRLPPYERLESIKGAIFDIWGTYSYGADALSVKVLKNYQRCMYEASLKVIKERRQAPACVAGRQHLVIYANGDVAFCEILKPFGNLSKEGIGRLLKSKEAAQQRAGIAGGNCFCHHNCNMLDNFFLNPFQYPKLLAGIRRP